MVGHYLKLDLTLVLLIYCYIPIMLMGGSKLPQVISSSRTPKTKFQRLYPCFEAELFNGVVDDVTGSRVIPEMDMAAA